MNKFSMLVYGQPGCGKTYLLGTAPDEMTPMLILDSDPGLLTLQSIGRLSVLCSDVSELPEERPPDGSIIGLTISDWQKFREAHAWLERHPGFFESVAWDSLTGLVELNRRFVLRSATGTDTRHDPDILEQRDYLRSQLHIETALRAFLTLDVSLMITGHVSMTDDPLSGLVIAPDLPNGIFRAVIRKLDIVALYHTISDPDTDKGLIRRLFLNSDGRFVARTRLPHQTHLDDPTLGVIAASLEPSSTKQTQEGK